MRAHGAKPNPLLETKPRFAVKLDYLMEEREIKVGEVTRLCFRLSDSMTNEPNAGLEDVRVRYLLASGVWYKRFGRCPTPDASPIYPWVCVAWAISIFY